MELNSFIRVSLLFLALAAPQAAHSEALPSIDGEITADTEVYSAPNFQSPSLGSYRTGLRVRFWPCTPMGWCEVKFPEIHRGRSSGWITRDKVRVYKPSGRRYHKFTASLGPSLRFVSALSAPAGSGHLSGSPRIPGGHAAFDWNLSPAVSLGAELRQSFASGDLRNTLGAGDYKMSLTELLVRLRHHFWLHDKWDLGIGLGAGLARLSYSETYGADSSDGSGDLSLTVRPEIFLRRELSEQWSLSLRAAYAWQKITGVTLFTSRSPSVNSYNLSGAEIGFAAEYWFWAL